MEHLNDLISEGKGSDASALPPILFSVSLEFLLCILLFSFFVFLILTLFVSFDYCQGDFIEIFLESSAL